MKDPISTRQLARGLRAHVPAVEDDRFVVTLAEVARHAPATDRRTFPAMVRLAAASAAVTLTVFGAAYAADNLSVQQPSEKVPADHTRIQDPAETPDDAEPSTDQEKRHPSTKRHHRAHPSRDPGVSSTSEPTPELSDDASVPSGSSGPDKPAPSHAQSPDSATDDPAGTDDHSDTTGTSGSSSGTSGSEEESGTSDSSGSSSGTSEDEPSSDATSGTSGSDGEPLPGATSSVTSDD